MTASETGLALRQRGVGIAAAGLAVQFIGVLVVVSNSGWAIVFVPVMVAAAAIVLSYTSVKDRTGLADAAAAATVVLAAVSAIVNSGWAGVLLVLAGAALSYFGNKQLAAGIRF